MVIPSTKRPLRPITANMSSHSTTNANNTGGTLHQSSSRGCAFMSEMRIIKGVMRLDSNTKMHCRNTPRVVSIFWCIEKMEIQGIMARKTDVLTVVRSIRTQKSLQIEIIRFKVSSIKESHEMEENTKRDASKTATRDITHLTESSWSPRSVMP